MQEEQKKWIWIGAGLLLFFLVVVFIIAALTGGKRGEGERRGFFGIFPQTIERALTPLGQEGETPGEEIVGKAAARVVTISQEPVGGFTFDKKRQKIVFILKSNGHVIESDYDGQNQEKISNITTIGISEVFWHPEKLLAAVFYESGGTPKRFLNDFATKKISFLPANLKHLSFSPDGREMSYITVTGGKTELWRAREDGSQTRKIFEIPAPDFFLSWPQKDVFVVTSHSSGFAQGISYEYNGAKRGFEKLLAEFGLTTAFSSDGKTILYSATNGGGHDLRLFLRNQAGTTQKTRMRTLPEKCGFAPSNERFYCALPANYEDRLRMPDDWYQGKIQFADLVAKVDAKTLEITEVPIDGVYDITQIKITPDEQYLFFVNKRDGLLYRLTLKD